MKRVCIVCGELYGCKNERKSNDCDICSFRPYKTRTDCPFKLTYFENAETSGLCKFCLEEARNRHK